MSTVCPALEMEGDSHMPQVNGVSAAPASYRSLSARIPAGAPALPFHGEDVRAAEQYRLLRTNIVQHPLQPRLMAIGSASPGDGKTITAINLAGTLALKHDLSVLLVDGDLRRSTVAQVLGIPAEPGLAEVLRGQVRLEEAIVRIEQAPNLYVLPSGDTDLNPTELLDSEACSSTFASFRERFSYVVVDTTPMTAVADFKLVSQLCDGTLVVVRPDHTNRNALMRAIEVAPQITILGAILNDYPDWFLSRTEDYYGYYYGESGSGVKSMSSGRGRK
ncbi:MAG TPA: CpsD/CapB family tyrosine-protein kinase [Bryobacteraceae bacterium]|nr:CpsD/CapB family tyrosine-protein kinase [Bryobacteraceae bacterium]